MVGLTTQSSQASEILTFPPDAIGINEADYQVLRTTNCSSSGVDSDAPLNCGIVVRALMENHLFYTGKQVVFRAEHYGEMYQIDNSQAGPLSIKRYLPDGFYKADKHYYWVVANTTIPLSRQTAYHRIILGLHNTPVEYIDDGSGPRNTEPVIPISNDDFNLFILTCEGPYDDEAAVTVTRSEACYANVERGRNLHSRLQRKIVLKVEDAGQLFYIPQNFDLGPQVITLEYGKKALWQTIKAAAVPIKKSILDQLEPSQAWRE